MFIKLLSQNRRDSAVCVFVTLLALPLSNYSTADFVVIKWLNAFCLKAIRVASDFGVFVVLDQFVDGGF